MSNYPPYTGVQPPFDGYKDRKTSPLEDDNSPYPLAPLNVNVQWSFNSDLPAYDIYWDLPQQLITNGNFQILGVNIYRANDSEYGPYFRLNNIPLGGTYYRDITTLGNVLNEDVSSRFLARGRNDEGGRYIFRVQNYPIVKPGTNAEVASEPYDVTVMIDGQEVTPARVYGDTGEIELRTDVLYDLRTNKQAPPILPKPDSVITCSYSYNLSQVTKNLFQRIFYRITTVGIDGFTGELVETPLNLVEARFGMQMENLDYIWREAIHRNQWILFQGGERVKVFIRKQLGPVCSCFDQALGQPRNSCFVCFGTGVRGGYEGPYEIILAPPDVERPIQQTEIGRKEAMTYDVWTGPQPLLSQRDFFVKLNGDRYTIGPVRYPTNRGNVLQQHFNVWLMDLGDIRQKVPVTGTEGLVFPQTRAPTWDDDPTKTSYPQITEKCEIPDEREERGRTPTYQNIVY